MFFYSNPFGLDGYIFDMRNKRRFGQS